MTRQRARIGTQVGYELVLPPVEERFLHSPSWVKDDGTVEGRGPVSLVMALEATPAELHLDMISAHRETLVAWTTLANDLLAHSGLDAPERRGIGFALLIFAAELASALRPDEFGEQVGAKLRSACTEAVAAGTLAAAGCLAATVMAYQESVE